MSAAAFGATFSSGPRLTPLFGVVAINGTTRTVVKTGEDRGELVRFATKRDAHPNALALGIRHEVAEVEFVSRSLVSGEYREVAS